MKQPVNILGGQYADETLPLSVQDTINYIPEAVQVEGARNSVILRGAPGERLSTIDTSSLSTKIRGMHVANDDMFIVGTDYMIRVNSSLTASNIGTIAGEGRVTFAHNQIAGGYELVINTGAEGYVYNSVTDVLTQITDTDFPGSYVTDYVDSYVLGVAPDGTYWFHSDLASATTYLSTDRYEAESDPDLIVTLIVDHREVWIMN